MDVLLFDISKGGDTDNHQSLLIVCNTEAGNRGASENCQLNKHELLSTGGYKRHYCIQIAWQYESSVSCLQSDVKSLVLTSRPAVFNLFNNNDSRP